VLTTFITHSKISIKHGFHKLVVLIW